MGNSHPSLFPYEPAPYRRRGTLIVTAGKRRPVPQACADVIGRPRSWPDEPAGFATNPGRTANRDNP